MYQLETNCQFLASRQSFSCRLMRRQTIIWRAFGVCSSSKTQLIHRLWYTYKFWPRQPNTLTMYLNSPWISTFMYRLSLLRGVISHTISARNSTVFCGISQCGCGRNVLDVCKIYFETKTHEVVSPLEGLHSHTSCDLNFLECVRQSPRSVPHHRWRQWTPHKLKPGTPQDIAQQSCP